MKLGKKPARIDPRTLEFKAVLGVLPPVPDKYVVDDSLGFVLPPHTWNNLKYGDCVMAARANQTQRFEAIEHHARLSIQTSAVVKEYFRESDGEDSGLVMLDSLNTWRQRGWKVTSGIFSRFKQSFKIHAFARIDPTDKAHVKAAIYLLAGCQLGLALPNSSMQEIEAKSPWQSIQEPPNQNNGHCVYVVGYDDFGPTCLTWGRRQPMSWEFLAKYADEAFAIVDEAQKWKGEKAFGIDVEKLESYLRRVSA